MIKKVKKIYIKEISLPDASFSDLLGKQSVRATFRLSERAIKAISIVAGHLGIKQKSLFDHLIDDSNALHAIAENIATIEFPEFTKIQKTFVLSRRTLNSLETISKTFGTPRDALVEYSIQRLETIIETERKKHSLREKLVSELAENVTANENLLVKSREILGEDDPVSIEIEAYLVSGIQAYKKVEAVIEKGKVIEKFYEK